MIAKLRLVFSITIVFLSFSSMAQTAYWKNTELNATAKQISKQRLRVNKGKAFILNQAEFETALAEKQGSKLIYFPNEDGSLIPFLVEDAHLFSTELAETEFNKTFPQRTGTRRQQNQWYTCHVGRRSSRLQLYHLYNQ